jgi:OOP family OmpA-OmpF porin
MHTSPSFVSRTLVAIAVAGSITLASSVFAQERLTGKPTKEQILQALTPQKPAAPAMRTRGLSLGAPADGSAQQQQQEAPAQTAAATGSGPAAAAPAPSAKAAAKPAARALDLEIPFEFNSDRLTQDGKDVLDQLGEALKSDQLSGASAIILEGHTDAKGSAAYNKVLSLKRAQSVKTYLSIRQSIPSSKLRAVGKGSTELADPKNPEDASNRRVRIIVDG